MHAVPVHVADQVHLRESYKLAAINQGRGREAVGLTCKTAPSSRWRFDAAGRERCFLSLLPGLEAAACSPSRCTSPRPYIMC